MIVYSLEFRPREKEKGSKVELGLGLGFEFFVKEEKEDDDDDKDEGGDESAYIQRLNLWIYLTCYAIIIHNKIKNTLEIFTKVKNSKNQNHNTRFHLPSQNSIIHLHERERERERERDLEYAAENATKAITMCEDLVDLKNGAVSLV